MNLEAIPLGILLGIIVSLFGWLVAHYLASARDRKNRERELRISVLSEAYLALVRIGIDGALLFKDKDGQLVTNVESAENAIAMIHLYGTKSMSGLATTYAKDMSSGKGDCTKLVNEIRKYIRTELGLTDINTRPHYLSVKVKNA
jgi:hypothetical protein